MVEQSLKCDRCGTSDSSSCWNSTIEESIKNIQWELIKLFQFPQEDAVAKRECGGTWFNQLPSIERDFGYGCRGDGTKCSRKPIKKMVAKALLHPTREGIIVYRINLAS